MRLPSLPASKVVKALCKVGYEIDRQKRSHKNQVCVRVSTEPHNFVMKILYKENKEQIYLKKNAIILYKER